MISVIIVTFNSKNVIGGCLDSLMVQTLQPDEIIVVDNDSGDYTADFIKEKYPSVKIISSPKNVGFAAANNIGISESKGEFIALLNPDATAEKTWIENLHKAITVYEKIGIVGSKIYVAKSSVIWSAGGKFSFLKPGLAFLIGSRKLDNGQYDAPAERAFVDSCAWIMRRSMIDKIGAFDPKFFLNVEDLDLCRRARFGGYMVMYEPSAVARHEVGHSLGRGELFYYWNVFGVRYFIRKYFTGAKKCLALANYGVYLAIIRFRFQKKVLILDAIKRALEDAKK